MPPLNNTINFKHKVNTLQTKRDFDVTWQCFGKGVSGSMMPIGTGKVLPSGTAELDKTVTVSGDFPVITPPNANYTKKHGDITLFNAAQGFRLRIRVKWDFVKVDPDPFYREYNGVYANSQISMTFPAPK